MILLAAAAAYADGSHHLAAFFQRHATGKDHDAAVVRNMDSIKIFARRGVLGKVFRRDIESPGGECFVDGDIDAAQPGPIHAREGEQVAPFIGDGDVHRLANFRRFRLGGFNYLFCMCKRHIAREYPNWERIAIMLKDKVALVTGAATGIGEGIARLFAAQGARVYLLDRDPVPNEATAASLRSESGFARAHTVDVCDPAAIARAVQAALEEFGRIDILVNNAGIFPRCSFVEMSEADWDHMHDVNLKGLFHTIQAVAPHMLSQRSGKIVNISSVTFHLGMPNMSHYISSKGGVIGLTRALAREFGPGGVYVNCITPGAIQTESEKHFVTPDDIRKFLESQCIQRRMTPLDIARTTLFLSSELSDGMTGQTLNVDGGWVMH